MPSLRAVTLLLVLAGRAHAEITAVVEADVMVREGWPATRYGASAVMIVDATPGRAAQGFLRIRVNGTAGEEVASARLVLRVSGWFSAGSDAGGALRPATCAWDERTLTWETRPVVDQEAIAHAGAASRRREVAWDVTGPIAAGGDGVYCFAVVGESTRGDDVWYETREADGPPRLEITLRPPPATTTTATSSTTTSSATSTTATAPTSTTAPTTTVTSTTAPTTTRTSTTTVTTTLAPTTTIAGPFACLANDGPLVTLSGTFADAYREGDHGAATRIDARAVTFLAGPTNLYPVNVGGEPGVCLVGATVAGQYDRTLDWETMHDLNNAGIAFTSAGFTVDGARIDNVTDGIRPRRDGGFTIRDAWLSYVRDDCLENDHLQDGLVEDSLFDGCYVGFSARPSTSIVASGYDGSTKVLTIRQTLVRLEPMPGPDGGSPDGVGHGGFFKWHQWNDPATSLSPKLALHGNVFLAERVGQAGGGRMGIPPGQVVSCSDNVMVWLGPGPFPGSLPAGCFTVTTDRGVWDAAVAGWHARHPELGR